jgi:tyrosyl-tRNA synthetase
VTDTLANPPERDHASDTRDLAVGTVQIVPEGGLEVKLLQAAAEERPLRVKLGIDPSGRELTLGHAVVLRKLRQFQELGHVAVLIVGDFTGRIGDPTGRSHGRRVLDASETADNAKTYLAQVLKILREDRLELRRNADWLEPMALTEVLRASQSLTVARLLERTDFATRYRNGQPITLTEFLYPMLQGLDSVAVAADIELGGTDQTFNNLVGRVMQRDAGMPSQVVITVPLLRGLDGADKMGKSLGNWVSVDDSADNQFGKLLSIGDDLVTHYAELCCDWTADRIAEVSALLVRDPLEAKRSVARRVVALYHGEDAARAAEDAFDARFRRKELPDDAPTFALSGFGASIDVIELLAQSGLAASKSEARRLLSGGGIRLDGVKLPPQPAPLKREALQGAVLQRGKLRAIRLV